MPVGGYIQKAFGFVTSSGLIVPSTSGGIALASSQSSISVILAPAPAAARMFIGTSGVPVGSGATDAQRVGFPIGGSGQFAQPFTLYISNPSLLAVSAETSGQILFVGIETP